LTPFYQGQSIQFRSRLAQLVARMWKYQCGSPRVFRKLIFVLTFSDGRCRLLLRLAPSGVTERPPVDPPLAVPMPPLLVSLRFHSPLEGFSPASLLSLFQGRGSFSRECASTVFSRSLFFRCSFSIHVASCQRTLSLKRGRFPDEVSCS